MNVFADLHHAGLYASLKYLFEDRLGFSLYRPIGIQWFKHGYWKIAEPYNNAEATIFQYLTPNAIPEDGTPPLNNTSGRPSGVYSIYDSAHDYHQKALTLDKFRNMNFEYVIASIPAHIDAYRKLITDTGSKAKLIYHIGNIGWHQQIPWDKVDNVMASVAPFPVPEGKNVVFYRQEFKTDLFDKAHSNEDKTISSFVNCLPNPELFLQLEQEMPDYKFLSYGITCRDGICQSVGEIAKRMKQARYGYHFKPGGDGYGHVIHNWFAAGKPVLVGLDDYRDKLASDLLEDNVTCIDLSGKRPIDIARTIKELDENGYDTMRNNVINRFKEVVNFEKDAEKVSQFLSRMS